MYTDEEFEELEQEERTLTDEGIAVMILLLGSLKTNLEKELRNFYQKYGKDGVVTYQEARKWIDETDHRRRLTVLLMLVSTNFKTTFDTTKPHFQKFLEGVIDKEIDFFDTEVDKTGLIFPKWGVDNKTWLDRLEEDFELWSNRIMADWKLSMLKRDTIDTVTDNLNKRFDVMEKSLEKLALTESTTTGTIVRREIFKELGVSKYRFYSQADERVCDVCGGLHGMVFPISAYEVGVTASPLHPRCRCFEIPIME